MTVKRKKFLYFPFFVCWLEEHDLSYFNKYDTRAGIVDHPLDVLFMVDRSASSTDVDLEATKCLLRNLTAHFEVAYYKKVSDYQATHSVFM